MFILKTVFSILLAVLIVFPICLLMNKVFVLGKAEGLIQKDAEDE